MNKTHDILQKLIKLMGFDDFSVSFDAENNRFSVFINDSDFFPPKADPPRAEKNFLPDFTSNLDHAIRLIARKAEEEGAVVDVNNYRKEREDLILELARAAARKVVADKQEMALPAMNAYERRLIHLELASRPDIKTESAGEGRDRYVMIRPI
ncbi:MAG: R3H domain-containing nucleic acid-binding protein [Patescibacteria group bacterium]